MNKYHARKTYAFGVTFDSKGEAARYEFLKAAEAEGVISRLERQVEFTLIPSFAVGRKKYLPTKYIADFTYYVGGEMVVEDFKGMKTKEYMIKRKLFAFVTGKNLVEVKKWDQDIPQGDKR